ncbi:MAG: hypothetical protein JW849_01230 [Phycisphaerae bacterium]|nr:hypothetical protein [Phycisphaerae bacterium]
MFKRRLVILLALIGAAFLIMLVRLGQLQLFRGDKYREAAELGLRSHEFPRGQRGRIFDRNGVILAEDVACHDFCLDYGLLSNEEWWKQQQVRAICREEGLDPKNPRDQADALAEFQRRRRFTWGLVERLAQARKQDVRKTVRRILRRVRRWRDAVGTTIRQEYTAHPVVTALSEEEVNSLRPLIKDAVGAALVPSQFRRYPQRDVACHLIGVTGPVFREEAERWNWGPDQAGYVERMRHNLLPGDVIGKTGVERMCEDRLRPRRGLRVYRRPGEMSYQEPAVIGRDVHLTLDVELQAELQNLLGRTGCNGAIVILDVPSGDVLAAASRPGFDLNTYRANYNDLAGLSKRPDANDPKKMVFTPSALRAKANRPLLGRALAGVYPPGSTVKPFTGLAGLGAKVITPHTPIPCTGVNRHARNGKPRCWIYKMYHGQTHGSLALFGGLKNSCNIYFVEVGHRLGPQRLTDWFGLFGFGERPEMGLSANEQSAGMVKRSGFVPSDAWFMAIGQGFAATPLQVAAAHATVARDGLYLSPRLSLENAPKQVRRQLPVTPAEASVVQRGMHAVVHEQGGTAYKHWRNAEADLDVEICGKTGTATATPLKIDTDGDGKRDTPVPGAQGDHAWFAGFAPYRQPQIAFAVILEYEGSGGKNAGPVAKEALRLCQKYGYLRK